MVAALDALATRLSNSNSPTAPGGRVTRTAAARLALKRGIEALQADSKPRGVPELPAFPDSEAWQDATEAIEQLAELDLGVLDADAISALGLLDADAISALGDLDINVLVAIGNLNTDVLDALDALDTSGIDALERLIGLDDRLDRILEKYE
ncbi:hypothetical protein H8E07_04575 [bacterium]|nr:hypothetical protein [bacterium]